MSNQINAHVTGCYVTEGITCHRVIQIQVDRLCSNLLVITEIQVDPLCSDLLVMPRGSSRGNRAFERSSAFTSFTFVIKKCSFLK